MAFLERECAHMNESRSNCLPIVSTVRFITAVLLSPKQSGGVYSPTKGWLNEFAKDRTARVTLHSSAELASTVVSTPVNGTGLPAPITCPSHPRTGGVTSKTWDTRLEFGNCRLLR